MSEAVAPVDTPVRSSRITWRFGAGEVRLVATDDAPVQMVSVALDGDAATPDDGFPHAVPLVELALGVEGRQGASPHGQHRRYRPSGRLRHVRHEAVRTGGIDLLTVEQNDPESGIVATTRLEHRPGASALRAVTHLRNAGEVPVTVRYVSSFTLAGFADRSILDAPDRLQLHHVRNAWDAEFRWRRTTLEDAGIVDIGHIGAGNDSSLGHFGVRGYGSWSSGDSLPVGAVSDTLTGRTWTWQVEHNGPWQWQALDRQGRLYVGMSGPTAADHEWEVDLAPGAEFTSVPVAVAVSADGLHGALAEITRYRRLIRRPHSDNATCPVIFNDYMNCLMGDPTTERLLPLVEAAAAAGAEYFVIDAGWYSDEPGWWDTVGEWQPAVSRFPNGLGEVIDAITAAGMVPGLWLEPEVVGVRSPLVAQLPKEALFCRDGRPLVENGRHQLDFRHPAVVQHLDDTVDRLVHEFGIGYFKLDYNINIGAGTDLGGTRPGAGLLGHNRAYSAWIAGVLDRHPDLVLENCSSGGMRVDYAQLALHSLQSTSDHTDPERYVPIAAAAPSCVTPEQSAVWAYPQPEWSTDLNDLTLVNALLGRVHLSGRIDLLDAAGRASVRQAMEVYKRLRHRIPRALPVWPLGLPGWYDPWCAAGLADAEGVLLQVWRRGGDATAVLPLPTLAGRDVDVEVLFPSAGRAGLAWSPQDATLRVELPEAPVARLLRLTPRPVAN
ncbi:glycoside hydrolase family 36 protein [Actinomycetes bacterium KLBMP 9759]